MNKRALIAVAILIPLLVIGGILLEEETPSVPQDQTGETETPIETPTETPTEPPEPESDYPKIASWLAKKEELIESGKPYDLVMAGWFTPEEAEQFRETNPDVILLAGLTTTWVWDNPDWMSFLVTVANYGMDTPVEINEDMYLHDTEGERCGFGWASEEWNQEEIWAMDPRDPEWFDLITTFYSVVLDQPQNDGIIVDMVVEKQYWCPEISDEEWLEATKDIYDTITALNTQNKLVIFNAGARLSDIDAYGEYFDGYLMENFMGDQLQTTYAEGLEAADSDYLVIYGVDTDDTGVEDHAKMRLGLTLSLLNDNTYFTYDFGPRDHGQAWWYPEYDVELGEPLGDYYESDGAYVREFENGYVVSAPNGATLSFDEPLTDVISGEQGTSFTVEAGDGRIYIR
ncbi:putative glycoside hydrolase family 15 protein [archaeon]|nr:putative glycoside hydrolase family 15 protein [archaeon]